jgi:hypothetical protein
MIFAATAQATNSPYSREGGNEGEVMKVILARSGWMLLDIGNI